MYEIMLNYQIDDNSGIWRKIGTSLQHYWVLQIAKINDPKGHGNHYNFSLEYFVDCVVKKDSYKTSYNKFRAANEEFIIEANRKARNKIVSHRDLEVFNSPDGVGGFPEGLDQKYFDSLHEIISEGYKELGLGFSPEWPTFIVNDTRIFMDKISKVFISK